MDQNHSISGNITSQLFNQLSNPARLNILLLIGRGEVCVCHLKAALSLRQACISQHLMALRASGWVKTRREGRNIYYRLTDPALLDVIHMAGKITHETLKTRDIPEIVGCPHYASVRSGCCSSLKSEK